MVKVHAVTGGLPGSYNYIMVFHKGGRPFDVENCWEAGESCLWDDGLDGVVVDPYGLAESAVAECPRWHNTSDALGGFEESHMHDA